MVSRDLKSCNPIFAIFTPSMITAPSIASSILNNDSVIELFPAPVRPTTPICDQLHTKNNNHSEPYLLVKKNDIF